MLSDARKNGPFDLVLHDPLFREQVKTEHREDTVELFRGLLPMGLSGCIPSHPTERRARLGLAQLIRCLAKQSVVPTTTFTKYVCVLSRQYSCAMLICLTHMRRGS